MRRVLGNTNVRSRQYDAQRRIRRERTLGAPSARGARRRLAARGRPGGGVRRRGERLTTRRRSGEGVRWARSAPRGSTGGPSAVRRPEGAPTRSPSRRTRRRGAPRPHGCAVGGSAVLDGGASLDKGAASRACARAAGRGGRCGCAGLSWAAGKRSRRVYLVPLAGRPAGDFERADAPRRDFATRCAQSICCGTSTAGRVPKGRRPATRGGEMGLYPRSATVARGYAVSLAPRGLLGRVGL